MDVLLESRNRIMYVLLECLLYLMKKVAPVDSKNWWLVNLPDPLEDVEGSDYMVMILRLLNFLIIQSLIL